jgi:hypothetical protein
MNEENINEFIGILKKTLYYKRKKKRLSKVLKYSIAPFCEELSSLFKIERLIIII